MMRKSDSRGIHIGIIRILPGVTRRKRKAIGAEPPDILAPNIARIRAVIVVGGVDQFILRY